MRLKETEPEEIKLNMTAMIDIVFQLLVFFIMTFKVVAMEGDFNIRMPLASQNQEESMDEDFPTIIYVQLAAGTNGNINSIIVDDDTTFSDTDMYSKLTQLVESKIAAEGNPEDSKETEVEFDIARELKYSYTVKAIEAVSGKVVDGQIKKLIQKIKFKDSTSF
ncbi:MAG: biopolymer transporter ExbD [Mariniblastus sp.]|nr:biopolymer transporter ExbD [Mariniblastus sp.]